MRRIHVNERSLSLCAIAVALALSAGTAGAEIIFDDNFDDTASATQSNLVAAVDKGSWVEIAIDSSVILADTSQYLNASRGDYDYTAVFSQYGLAATGGTISLDLSFGDSVHDYNTASFLEGTSELFRIEVQTDDGDHWINPVTPNYTDAQINLVGAATINIGNGIRENATPNRTFEFTLDATGVDLSITGDGLDSALTGSVNYAHSPLIGPDRIRFFKNDLPQVDNTHKSDRGKLRVDNVQVDFEATVARNVLIDFSDGNAGNGIHDVAVRDGGFTGQPLDTGISPPWQALQGGEQFKDDLPPGIGSDRNGVMVTGRVYAVDTGHTLAQGDVFNLEYFWRDAWQWDSGDSVEMVLYYTDTDAIDGVPVSVFALNSGSRDATGTWEGEYGTSAAFADDAGVGKTLFAKLQADSDSGAFARMDNIFLEVVAPGGGNQPGGTVLVVR
jgi:hypothetical protein